MPTGVRLLAAACASAVVLGVPVPATAAAPDIERKRPGSFIEALAAIPDASVAVQEARAGVPAARQTYVIAQSLAASAQSTLATANQRLYDAAVARVLAEKARDQAQDSLDEAARLMYSSGGAVPTLAEVMLTADTAEGFTHSLITRQYLSSAVTDILRIKERTDKAVIAATTAGLTAQAERDSAAAIADDAQQRVDAVSAELGSARAQVKDARSWYRTLMRMTSVDHSAEYGRIKSCGDWVTKLLSRSGFTGEDLREAWAIVMRESGGREDAVSATQDLGLFQVNTATWKSQPWFDRRALLTRTFNAKIGYLLSNGGKSWYSWGLDGHGRPDAGAYVKSGWTPEHIRSSIIVPYISWYSRYPCRPSYENDFPYPIPEAPRADEVPDSLSPFAGDGYSPDDSPPVESPALRPPSGGSPGS